MILLPVKTNNLSVPDNLFGGYMKKVLTLVFALLASSASAQVLTTAETLGKGKQMVVVSENHLDDAGTGINIAYAMYIRGLTSRFDLYTAVGETHLLGEGQAWAAVGGNAKLFSARKISVSLFTLASVPLHRFSEASPVLLNTALVVSRPISSKLSVYSGVNTLVPIGNRDQAFFTPAQNKLNFPLGASLALGNWGITAEADLGKMKAVGVALSRTY